jgi:hypothetical protein
VPFRRYAPALIVAAALLLLVIVAPSRGNTGSGLTAYPAFSSTSGPTTPGTTASNSAGGKNGAKSGVQGGTGSGQGTTGPSGTTSGSQSGGGTQSGATSGGSSGSTAHCVGSKQFAVSGFVAAPPCQPTFAGNNGGATYKGVTSSQIEIVYYQPKQSLALKAILGPAGLAPSVGQVNDYLARVTQFVNSRYELWGRQIHIDDYVSPSCQASPPSDDCFRQDAQTVAAKYHPFAVLYPRNLTAPGFQEELSHLGIVNFGGAGLPASFDTSQRPYHYDNDMDGDTQAELTGEWYCKELANRKATYAGSASLRAKARTAEILVEDTPEHVAAAQHLASIINNCDHGGGAIIKTFSPDTSQAVIQTTTLASQAKQSGITTLLYFTDPVLPVFLTKQLTDQNYYPENVLVGSGYLDFDPLGQLYDKKQWADAFGLGDLGDMGSPSVYDAGAVYRATHGSQQEFNGADNIQSFFSELCAGLQQAGADLNPGTFEHAMLTLPSWGGTRYHSLIKYGPGDYTGVSDARLVYWDPTRRSPVNGKAGTYVALNGGKRYTLGQFPSQTFTIPGR